MVFDVLVIYFSFRCTNMVIRQIGRRRDVLFYVSARGSRAPAAIAGLSLTGKATKPFPGRDDNVLKHDPSYGPLATPRAAAMISILNLIYSHFIHTALPGIEQGARR
jgi:hypothetical protein